MKKSDLNKLASRIAALEGKKSEVSIGNIREVIRCIVEIELEDLKSGNALNSTLAKLFRASVVKYHAHLKKKRK